MCGIVGLMYHDRQKPVRQESVKKMCDTLVHRGPDDEGFYVDRNVGIGMRRLTVIDLSTGHQPMTNEDGRYWIVFNGEIYNYPELRKELESKGHRFSTHTDTETIVHAYEEFGEACVERLNGMFAFALWDREEEKLVLARDRLGVKPLYYYEGADRFVFGSELKAVLADPNVPRVIDFRALDRFLTFEYIPSPLSVFQGILKLPPGHLLTLEKGKTSLKQYWNLPTYVHHKSEEELTEVFYDLMKDAVKIRLISDVPLGAFLSGGVDSSTIVCMMSELMNQPVKTFSIGFDDPSYNELDYARAVAKHYGAEHQDLIIQPNVVDLVEDLIKYLDEPLADVSVFPTYLVSKLAREQVTVVLSGDGGDELFGGYDWYLAEKISRSYQKLPLSIRTELIPFLMNAVPPASQKKGFVNKAKRFVEGTQLPEALQHFRWNIFLSEDRKATLYRDGLSASLAGESAYAPHLSYLREMQGSDPLWQQQYADIKTYMVDDILVKVDRMSMANSLEARTPFLDYRIAEFAAGLPPDLKLKGFKTKWFLKQAMRKKLPPFVIDRKKEGFSIPMKNWLKGDLNPMMQDLLSPDRINNEGLFQSDDIEKMKKEHLAGTANHAHQLWSLMVFETWRDLYLN